MQTVSNGEEHLWSTSKVTLAKYTDPVKADVEAWLARVFFERVR